MMVVMPVSMDLIRQSQLDLGVDIWRAHALCLEFPEVEWIPTDFDPATEARAICARCPVRAECLDHALRTNEQYGIWGGTNVQERRALKRAA